MTGAMHCPASEVPRRHLPHTGVKIALAAAHFHGIGVARQGPWLTWVNRGKRKSRSHQRARPSIWWRYGSLGSMQKNDLVPLHTSYLPAGGACGGAAQLVGVLLALVHGLFTLPEGHHLYLAALAVGEGQNGVEPLHLGERGR